MNIVYLQFFVRNINLLIRYIKKKVNYRTQLSQSTKHETGIIYHNSVVLNWSDH